jgi:hypothetical protein
VVAQEGEDGVGLGGGSDADPAGSHGSGGGGEAAGGDEVGGGVQIGGSREGRRGIVVTDEGAGLEGIRAAGCRRGAGAADEEQEPPRAAGGGRDRVCTWCTF